MPLHLSEIRAFLNRPGIEGPQQLCGYIPCYRKSGGTANYRGPESGGPEGFSAMGVSGVTIATGVDLGQTDAATLERGGLDAGSVTILRPYFGLRKDDALRRLCTLPLTVSQGTADGLDTATLGIHAGVISARYDRDNPATPFEALPWQAQAAIFSLLFQRGTGAAGKEPDIWNAFVRGDWLAASAILRDAGHWMGDQAQYRLRRRMEGELLMEVA